MSRTRVIAHEFVDYVPEIVGPGVLFISIRYKTAVHQCCCGCGTEIATALSQAGWAMTFNGATVSLHPSIGNWSLPCQSHYWIREGRVVWAPAWTRDEIAMGREQDRRDRLMQLAHQEPSEHPPAPDAEPAGDVPETLWQRIRRLF